MSSLYRTFLTSLMAVAAITAAADVTELPVTTIDGTIYHYYKVERKESLYSVMHKLNVTKEELLTYNPSVIEGLKAGQLLYFPFKGGEEGRVKRDEGRGTRDEGRESSAPAPAPATEGAISPVTEDSEETVPEGMHLVRRGETIYSLARRYGVSEENLLAWNPALATEGLKADSRIYITAPAGMTPVIEKRDSVPAVAPVVEPVEGHLVKEKETFYSIARQYGISVAELEAANPEVSLLRTGMVLNIPAKQAEYPDISDPSDPSDHSEISDTSDHPDTSIDIALILPFMTGQEPVSKQAQRFTEFYKGFLIAVDSMRRSRKAINITAFDSHASTDSVRALLSRPALKDMDVIIAPDNAAQMAYIARWGLENNVKVFNPFVIKDDTYVGNPMMLQSNIPSETMVKKAVSLLVESLDGATPVILSPKTTDDDKADFLKELNSALAARGIEAVTVEYDGRLSPAAMTSLDATGSYVFIPATGKQAEVNKMLPGIVEWHRVSPTATISVWGYPEWIAFRGETLQNMHALNTTIYSRFAPDEDDSYRNRKFDAQFKRWYGTEMENVTPRQGLLGFDTGMYLLRLLLLDNPLPSRMNYTGIQNDYNFIQVDGGGWVNNSLTLVNYRPGGSIHKSTK